MVNKNKGGAPEHKLRSPTFKAQVLAEIGKYDRRGYSQHKIVEAIAPLVKLSQPRVCILLKEVRVQYKNRIMEDRAEKVNEMLEMYRDVRAEAWAAYERSREDTERLVRESVKPFEVDGDESKKGRKNSKGSTGRRGESAERSLVLLKEIVTTEGRLPANVYLQTVLDTLKAERELLGLDAPKEVDITQRSTILSFDDLIRDQLNVVQTNDPVEDEISAIEAQIPKQEEGGDGEVTE